MPTRPETGLSCVQGKAELIGSDNRVGRAKAIDDRLNGLAIQFSLKSHTVIDWKTA